MYVEYLTGQKMPNDLNQFRRIEACFTAIIEALDLDLNDANLADTPNRATRALLEILEGLSPEADEEIKNHLTRTFPTNNDNMVVARNIQAWGMCPHHFLPVNYKIDIGYIPNGRALGLSKLPRLAILLAKRPVLQEDLTQHIASMLQDVLSPSGVAVRVTGVHACMQIRGVKADGASVTTTYVTGAFRDNLSVKTEFLQAITG